MKTYQFTLIASFIFVTSALAVSPPPDGGYPNQTTAEGENALFSLTTGASNTAVGFEALFSNTIGYENTATGSQALFSNTEGLFNTATGTDALYRNTTGSSNTATGASTLNFNTTGEANTATGAGTLLFNTTGSGNTATGFNVLASNTTGSSNTADGFHTLLSNRTGRSNTAIGSNALLNNSTGNNNIALGESAGVNLTTGGGNIDVGNAGVAGEANTIRIGKKGTQTATFIAGIRGTTIPTGIGVLIDTSGRLGTSTSSARFKDGIKPMDRASEAILTLQPVTFRYKKELDPNAIPQFGLVAEEVEKVSPELVAYDDQGKPYTVRYEAANAMLLNEFLKEHRKGLEQDATISQLKAGLAQQQNEIKALTAQIQKVGALVEVSKSAPQTVLNNR